MKQITSVEELHSRLLMLGIEFHRICSKHNIPYFMLGGTMLGAIRHSNFIPWDDDMDFGVPREHFAKLKMLLEKELPQSMKVLTMDNAKTMYMDIIKINDNATIVNELFKENAADKDKPGLSIDIFPLDPIAECNSMAKLALDIKKIQGYRCLSIKPRPWSKKIVASVVKVLFCWLTRKLSASIQQRLLPKGNNIYLNLYGAWGAKEAVSKDVFGTPTLYPFGDVQFYGVEQPHQYLTQLYGDYMKLPPEEARHLHVSNVYYR